MRGCRLSLGIVTLRCALLNCVGQAESTACAQLADIAKEYVELLGRNAREYAELCKA